MPQLESQSSGTFLQARATSNRLAGKRVAMVTFSPYPQDPRPRRAIDAFVSEGAQVDLICLESNGAARHQVLNGLEVTRLPIKHQRGGKFEYAVKYGGFIFAASAIFALRSLTRRYDIVHVHNMPDVLVVSALVPKMLGAKVILDLHDPMPELMMTIFGSSESSKAVRLLKTLEKWSIARADLVITVNRTCKTIFSARSCKPEKIAVVMNSPDDRIFPFSQPRVNGCDGRPSNSRPFVVMYHGSLVERNGLDLAVDALARLRQTVPTAELNIFGVRTPFLDRVLETVRSKGLQDAVHYFGPKSLDSLVTEIEKCDVGVVPNHRNAFTEINTPTRIFEYLALGKPVIAPATPGVQDYFSPRSLLFFEPGNSDDLARRLEHAFFHPDEVLEITKEGQRIYLEHRWDQEREVLLSSVSGLLKCPLPASRSVAASH